LDFGQKGQDQLKRNSDDGFSVIRQFGIIVKTSPPAIVTANSQALAIGTFDQKDTAGRA
jgi:hypothetical protein